MSITWTWRNTSLKLDARAIPEFDHYTGQTSSEHIFIAGDVNNELTLLHEAADEGRIAGGNAGRSLENPKDVRAGHRRAPLGLVFSEPQIATIGQTLRQIEKHCDGCYAVGEVSFEGQGRSRVMGKNKGILKVYAEQGSGLVLGRRDVWPQCRAYWPFTFLGRAAADEQSAPCLTCPSTTQ